MYSVFNIEENNRSKYDFGLGYLPRVRYTESLEWYDARITKSNADINRLLSKFVSLSRCRRRNILDRENHQQLGKLGSLKFYF